MKVNGFWDPVQSGRYLPKFRTVLLSPSTGYMESVRPIRRQNPEYNNLVQGSNIHNDDACFFAPGTETECMEATRRARLSHFASRHVVS
jgi:hypothetical protein